MRTLTIEECRDLGTPEGSIDLEGVTIRSEIFEKLRCFVNDQQFSSDSKAARHILVRFLDDWWSENKDRLSE